jgi:hypothetical protein
MANILLVLAATLLLWKQRDHRNGCSERTDGKGMHEKLQGMKDE